MITSTELYFLLMLDSIDKFLTSGAIACGIGLAAGTFMCLIAWDDSGFRDCRDRVIKVLKRLAIALPLFVLSAIAVPDTKEMAAILFIPRVLNSEFVQEDIPEEAREMYDLTKEWIRTQVSEKKKVN